MTHGKIKKDIFKYASFMWTKERAINDYMAMVEPEPGTVRCKLDEVNSMWIVWTESEKREDNE